MFIGVDGFDLEEGLTTPTMGMAGVERAMIAQTRGEVVALADASKIGVVADVVICGLDQVDTVLVDDGVDDSRARGARATGAAMRRRLMASMLTAVNGGRSEVAVDVARANELYETAVRLAADAAALRDALQVEFLSGQLAEVVASDYDLGQVLRVEQIFGGYVNLSFAVVVATPRGRAPLLRAQVQGVDQRARRALRARAREPPQRQGLHHRRARVPRPSRRHLSSGGRNS